MPPSIKIPLVTFEFHLTGANKPFFNTKLQLYVRQSESFDKTTIDNSFHLPGNVALDRVALAISPSVRITSFIELTSNTGIASGIREFSMLILSTPF